MVSDNKSIAIITLLLHKKVQKGLFNIGLIIKDQGVFKFFSWDIGIIQYKNETYEFL